MVATARQRRVRAGLSCEDIATQVGVTAAYIRMLERGERFPSVELVELLRPIYGNTIKAVNGRRYGPAGVAKELAVLTARVARLEARIATLEQR